MRQQCRSRRHDFGAHDKLMRVLTWNFWQLTGLCGLGLMMSAGGLCSSARLWSICRCPCCTTRKALPATLHGPDIQVHLQLELSSPGVEQHCQFMNSSIAATARSTSTVHGLLWEAGSP